MSKPLYIVRDYSFITHEEAIVGSFEDLDDALDRAGTVVSDKGKPEAKLVLEDDGIYRARLDDVWVTITTHDRPPVSDDPERPDYVRCATREDETRRLLGLLRKTDVITWCGRRAWMEWNFIDAGHALISCARGNYTMLCAECSAAMREALDQGSYDCVCGTSEDDSR